MHVISSAGTEANEYVELLQSHRIVVVEGNYLLMFGDSASTAGAAAAAEATDCASKSAGTYDPESLAGISADTFAAPIWAQLGGYLGLCYGSRVCTPSRCLWYGAL